MAVATQQNAPGSLYGVPGITRTVEDIENNDGNVTTLAQSTSVTSNNLIPLRQTDVVKGWNARFVIAPTITLNTDTVTLSPYFPWNFLGRTRLNMQNQVNTIDVESGIDLAIFNRIRPEYRSNSRNVLWGQPATSAYSAAANIMSSNSYAANSTSLSLPLYLPAGLQFDEYFALDPNGVPANVPPLPMFVSPQFMAGTGRIVQPIITYNQAIAVTSGGGTSDNGPYIDSAAAATFTGTSTLYLKRNAIYQPTQANGSDSPPIAPWQYTIQTVRRTLSGVSKASLQLPINGQVLSVYVRMFDPAANSGKGAVIGLSALTEADLVYGSGLYKFQDRPEEVQQRYDSQHNEILTDGVLCWDMALDRRGRITNANALNTMNTSGIQVNLTFTGAQSSSAYAVVGVEALTYVAVGN